jgi:hypothetical protein
MSSIKTEELDQTVYRLLGKAGLDPRCTPNILRAKTESKMKLETGDLVPFKLRIKKLIIKWWKDTQTGSNNSSTSNGQKRTSTNVEEPTKKKIKSEHKEEKKDASPSVDMEALTKYKAWRTYTKALARHDLLQGLTEIKDVDKKIIELRKRLQEAGLKHESLPTEEDITKAEKETAAKAS